jgi:chromosome segregation ATPase
MDAVVNRSQDDQSRRVLIMELQRELVMLESDARKIQVKKEQLEMDIKRLGIDKQRLRMSEDEKRSQLVKLENDMRILQDDIQRTKKKMGAV